MFWNVIWFSECTSYTHDRSPIEVVDNPECSRLCRIKRFGGSCVDLDETEVCLCGIKPLSEKNYWTPFTNEAHLRIIPLSWIKTLFCEFTSKKIFFLFCPIVPSLLPKISAVKMKCESKNDLNPRFFQTHVISNNWFSFKLPEDVITSIIRLLWELHRMAKYSRRWSGQKTQKLAKLFKMNNLTTSASYIWP